MRAAVALALCCSASLAAAESPPALIGKLTPPEGRFFDESFAISADGKQVAAVATDAATQASLYVWNAADRSELILAGLPVAVVSVAFVAPDRILVVAKKEGSEQVLGQLASLKASGPRRLVFDRRLGPATAIEVIEQGGKRLISIYQKEGKRGTVHSVTVLDGATLKQVARRSLAETNEGLLRSRSGELRAIWWSEGHTRLAAQKIGEYDKARDMRRPDRFLRLDLITDKVVDEHEIEDVLAFAQVAVLRRSAPAEEAFARLSDDRKAILLLDGQDERALPLARDLLVYEPASLRWQTLDDKTLAVGLQVDAQNAIAVAKRVQHPDDFDLYLVDRASLHGKNVSARRALVLPGGGRPVGFAIGGGHIALLRKAKGFDHGGIEIDLYALP